MQTSDVNTTFAEGTHLSKLIKNLLPMKKAMKIESNTPVDRVKVVIPKKKQPRSVDELLGIAKSR